MESTLSILGISFVAGVVGAVLGVGGGIIIVPALTLLLGVPIHIAIGSSITAVIATSSAATTSYLRQGYVNVRLGLFLEVSTIAGAVLGGFAAVSMRPDVLQALFAIILLYAAIIMALRTQRRDVVPQEATTEVWLTESFLEPTTGQEVVYTPKRTSFGLAGSVFAGAISGMLGVGGGIIKVPLMTAVMSVPVRAAMATSAFMIGLTGAGSAFIYYFHGFVVPGIAGPTALGILVGARVGTRLAQFVKPHILTILFAILLFISAVRMLLEVIK